MMKLRNFAILTLGTIMIFGAGCGGDPAAKSTNTLQPNTDAGGQDAKINEALAKAGLNKFSAILPDADDTTWLVTITPDGVGPNGESPPGRPIPKRARVKKSDFSVEVLEDPNKGRGGKQGKREIE